jgi:hypothetical protein
MHGKSKCYKSIDVKKGLQLNFTKHHCNVLLYVKNTSMYHPG